MNILGNKILIDTHCHLNDGSFDDDRDEVVKRAVDAGVTGIVDIGVNIETSKKAIENSKKYKGVVYASVGIDPEVFVPGNELFDEGLFSKSQIEIGEWISEQMRELEGLIDENVVMIGECGMDYHWLNENNEISKEDEKKSKLLQRLLFASQVELSIKRKLPLSIHSRGAESECIEVIKTFKEHVSKKNRGNNSEIESDFNTGQILEGSFHSFTGTVSQAKEIVKLGFKIGVNGIVTYQKAENVREVVHAVGAENIVYETDAPYLVPSGFRPEKKRRNEPSSLVIIQKYIEKIFS